MLRGIGGAWYEALRLRSCRPGHFCRRIGGNRTNTKTGGTCSGVRTGAGDDDARTAGRADDAAESGWVSGGADERAAELACELFAGDVGGEGDGAESGAEFPELERQGDPVGDDHGAVSGQAERVSAGCERVRSAPDFLGVDAADKAAEQLREIRLPEKMYAYGVTRVELEQVTFGDGTFWMAMGRNNCSLNVTGTAERVEAK